MLSDETVKNTILYRQTTRDKTMRAPFVVSMSPPFKPNSIEQNREESVQKKTLKIFRPETLKRAHNDSILAASIGDLDWLKQTMRIIDDTFFDKNVLVIVILSISLIKNAKIFFLNRGLVRSTLPVSTVVSTYSNFLSMRNVLIRILPPSMAGILYTYASAIKPVSGASSVCDFWSKGEPT